MNTDAVADILNDLCIAFSTRDLTGLLAQFADNPTATYAGSESGETATGRAALRILFDQLFARGPSYHFDFAPPIWSTISQRDVWVLADGTATENRPDREPETFPYRVTGVLTHQRHHWRWQLLTGCEPTHVSGSNGFVE